MQDPSLRALLQDDYVFESLMRYFTPEEQLNVLNKKSRAEALVALIFQRIVVNYGMFVNGDTVDFVPMKCPPLSYNEYGKAKLAHSDLEFNSSTSDDLICIILQFGLPTPVGVDLSHEHQDAIAKSDYVARFAPIFSKEELGFLERQGADKYAYFNQLWTLKEAFTKFLGCGLNTDLSRFWFSWDKPPKVPLGKRKPVSELVYERSVSWQEATVNLANMEDEWKCRISSEPVRCTSALLTQNGEVCTFISAVAQADVQKTRVFELDMAAVVQTMV